MENEAKAVAEAVWSLPFFSGDTWVAIFTLALVAVTGLLFLATRSLVQEGRASAKIDLRAYLSVVDSKIGPVEPGKPVTFEIVIRNTGKSPAHKVRVWTWISPTDYPQVAAIVLPKEERFSGTIGPQQIVRVTGAAKHPPDAAFVTALNSKTAGFIIRGNATYIDIWKRTHETPWSLIHGGEFGNEPGSLWRTEMGNDAN